ncbi:DUF2087 domain-containing protein [Burkholderia catarinensis]|uniref:DUF2087 domain-containing protein n=1 Tax=Burkholderia catarinensis TaxID=1108140 RepID=UPI000920B598|nr:DUF2087 domain-containing protein [Burkholderia catarinensis]KAG8152470.1 hypothetical protein BFF94_017265 [Burkholderia catarinensis]
MKELVNTQLATEQPSALAVLEKLAAKQGITLGNLSSGDMSVILALASVCIEANTPLAEPAVNQALKQWLGEAGSMLRIDHVELRRTLIDLRYWQRDGFGRSYERRPLPGDHPAHDAVAALESIDVARFVADARTRHETLRAERMAAHARKNHADN